MHKINYQYEFISTIVPEVEYVNIVAKPNLEIENFITFYKDDNIRNIEKINKKIYKLPNTLALNPYFNIFYKIYFDENENENENENINICNNKLSDIGIFIYEQQLRSFAIKYYMTDIPCF